MATAAELIFWICCTATLGAYIGYPMLLLILGVVRRRYRTDNSTPFVTLVISAYNEVAEIEAKLLNSLALDYPADRLEIVVISDASDDGTDAIVERFKQRGVVLYRQDTRAGKSAGLTRFVPRARGEIIVFSDANSLYRPDAIRKLVRHFADSKIGYVVGHQRYVAEDAPATQSETTYWQYECWIKEQESRLGSVVGGDGAIMAIRAELFEPLLHDDINDFVLPLRIVVRGYRGIFDREAVCFERAAANFQGEFRRKARIVNRSVRAVLRVPNALNPFCVGFFAFQLLLHKMLRWFTLFFLASMLVTSVYLCLSGNALFNLILALELTVVGVALLRFVPLVRKLKPVYLCWYFCVVSAAAGWGVLTAVAGNRIAIWKPERTVETGKTAAVPESAARP